MKFTFLIVIISVLQATASVYSQNQRVTVEVKNAKFEQILGSLEKQTDYTFMYSITDIELISKKDINEKNQSLFLILDKCLKESNLMYKVIDRTVIIFPKDISERSDVSAIEKKEKIIKGKVTDPKGNPLPGVSVIVKGTQVGVATDIDGNFELKIEDKKGQVLVFSFIGMKPHEVVYKDQANLKVVLEPDTEQLEEVVITGYQTISKERATGSFSSITNEALEKKMHSDLTKVIEGMTTGLVTDSEGNITIRGASTFEAEAQPLIVLDGFPYEGKLNSINPDNIENITVLKDGVAASIYGARSANGVIVVTTKKGKKGDFRISYKATFSTTQKTDLSDLHRSSTSDYIDGQIAKYDSAPYYYYPGTSARPRVDYLLMQAGFGVISREDAMEKIDKYRDVDAYSQIEKYGLRNQFAQQHNITISGGGEKNLFNASLNYFDEKGEELMSEKSRFIFDIKNTWKPKDFISFSTSANIVYKKTKNSKTNMLGLIDAWGIQPYDPIVDEYGNPVEVEYYVSPTKIAVYEARSSMKPWGYSPLEDMKLGKDDSNDLQARLSANLSVDIFKGLNVSIGGAWTRGNSNIKGIYAADSHKVRIGYNDASSATDPTKHYLPEGALLDESRNFNESYTLRSQINFNRVFDGEKHRVSALVGNEIRRDQYDRSILPTKVGYNPISGDYIFIDNKNFNSFYDPNVNDYNFGSWNGAIPFLGCGKLEYRDNRFVSWYGNGSYEYDNKLIISGSIRLDLTNFFGTDPKYRYKPLWSVGGTYKISNEKWFKVDAIDRLNIRASYGINGNISMTEGPFLISESLGYEPKAQEIAYSILSSPNNQLRWEKTSSTNFGIDIALLQSRINLSVDLYKKHSTDLLAPDSNDSTTGVTNLLKNAGEITNKGIEITLNADVIRTNKFSHNTILNFSYNKNMVDEYNTKPLYVGYYFMDMVPYKEGYSMNTIWGYRGAPLSNQGDAQAYDEEGNLIHPDNIGEDDIIYLGTSTPKVNIAWTNTFSYKDFEASFMFIGSFGAKFWQDVFTGNNIENRHISEAWKNPGDEEKTVYPKISFFGAGGWCDKADYFIQSADYIKLRDVTLSYTLPPKWLKTIGFKRAKVFMQGRNLLTITRKGVDIDPETKGLPLKTEFYTGLSFEF